jgi:hypothetical protein
MYPYCWHELTYNAVKVGSGMHPERRMRRYAEWHQLVHAPDSLVTLDCHGHSRAMERHAHMVLQKSKLLNFQTPRELFVLNQNDYHHIIVQLMERCMLLLRPLVHPAVVFYSVNGVCFGLDIPVYEG